jgi:uncharacterized RDD family membrane protein YckC
MIFIEGKNKNLAGRYCSSLIDYAIVFLLTGLVIYALGEPNNEGGYTVTGMKALSMPLIWFVYFPLCESLAGQTLGKRIFDLYLIDQDGHSPSIIQTFSRRLLDPVEMAFAGIPGLIAINHSKKNQRLGDMLAETFVISTQATCASCKAALQLEVREAVRKSFECPACKAVNET